MPELPDVDVLRTYVNATALHQPIADVDIPGKGMLEGVSPARLKRSLKGHAFASTDRYGKYLFLEVTDAPWLVLHFGMTGSLRYTSKRKQRPEYERMVVHFENGYHLSYTCQRKLGLITMTDNIADFVARHEMGPDPCNTEFTSDTFLEAVSSSRAAIKSALMDQSRMAGIGNVYSDEICFQARVHPRQPANSLSDKELEQLYKAMMESVLPRAIDARAQPERFPDAFLTKVRGKQDAACPRCGHTIEHSKISGRTAYFCPRCQKQ